MAGRVLHVLSQRPLRTGSGITLDALVRHASRAGWQQWAVVGTPAADPQPAVGDLPPERIHPVRFGRGDLDFPLPGMSDVMPYESSRFSMLTQDQLASYRRVWRERIAEVCAEVRPDLIHVHHVWLVASLLADAVPGIPVVNHCHATGLRQMDLCPHLAAEVRRGCARNTRFVVLHAEHGAALARCLALGPERIVTVGAGYREELFHRRGRGPRRTADLIYVGKLSFAKGLPELLDAFARLEILQRASGGGVVELSGPLRLHVVGSGAGPEAEALRHRMVAMPGVVGHGALSQPELAGRLRRCALCVLPSFYEGLPLVLVEAIACGCRAVATAVPGVVRELVPRLGDAMEVILLPRLVGADEPLAEDLPHFVAALTGALRRGLRREAQTVDPEALDAALAHFTWHAVFRRVEAVWRDLRRPC